MNLQALASHTVDMDLLPEEPVVLDVGCRWFDFVNAIQIRRKHAQAIAMDPARDVVPPTMETRGALPPFTFLNAALVGGGHTFQKLAHFSTGEGDFLTTLDRYHDAEMYEVPCLRIRDVMRECDVTHFDLVKLDCEGSEFGILENWPGPIATQISVEFHDWQNPAIRDGSYYDQLMRNQLRRYRLVQHDLSVQGTGLGHWDSLLCLK